MSLPGKIGWVAGGNVGKCRFVEMDPATDGRVTEANAATDYCIGISGEGSENPPALGLDTTYHATAGYPCKVYEGGDLPVLLEISAAVVRGNRLKASAADGRGQPAAAGDASHAIALQSSTVVGSRVLVKIVNDTVNT